MKNKIIIISISVMLMSCFANAQPYSATDKKTILDNLDSALYKYMMYSTLTKPGETKLKVKDNQYIIESFKYLFIKDATIYDDINARFNEKAGKYECITHHSRDDYWRALIDSFPLGFKINNLRLNVNYNTMNQGFFTAALERNIEGMSQSNYNFYNHDTLIITMIIKKDLNIAISRIESIGSHIKCKNDNDDDGVINPEDDCPDLAGRLNLKGCPDKDGDGFPDKDDDCIDLPYTSNRGCPPSTFAYRFVLSVHSGVQINNNDINMPQFDPEKNPLLMDFIKDDVPKSRSKAGNATPDKSFNASYGYNFGAYVAYFIGRNSQNRNKGVALGINYINYKVDYNITGFHYEYKDEITLSDGSKVSFRRIVSPADSAKGITERAQFSIFNFPLLFKIKSKFNTQKWAGELSAGPSYLFSQGKVIPVADAGLLSVEGIFQYNQTGGVAEFPYAYNQNYIESPQDILITNNGLGGHNFNPKADTVFNSLNAIIGEQYAFGNNYEAKTEGNNFKLRGLGLNFMFDVYYHINARLALRLGGSFVYSFLKNPNKGEQYEMLKRTGNTNTYQSIFEGNKTANYTAYGIYTGIVYGLNFKKE